MSNDEVYQQWKQQRAAAETRNDFADVVKQKCHEESSGKVVRLLDRPVVAAAAVLAASLIGIIRVVMTVFIGIQAQ